MDDASLQAPSLPNAYAAAPLKELRSAEVMERLKSSPSGLSAIADAIRHKGGTS